MVDRRQLHENFAELDDQQAAELVGWLVRAFTTVEPSAKLGATAPYGGVRECVIEIGRRQPRSLIGAFEQPVRPEAHGSLSEAARKRLAAHAEEMDGLVGGVDWRGYLRDFAGKDRPAVENAGDCRYRAAGGVDDDGHSLKPTCQGQQSGTGAESS